MVSGRTAASQAARASGWAGGLLPAAGVVVYVAASAPHGGAQPDDLPAVLPQYAANGLWLLSHAGQLLGMLLMLAGWAALLSRLSRLSTRPALAAPAATGARWVLALAAAVFTVNQAVDGVAIRHVAQVYVDSPAQLRPASLLVADAVRHVEIGLTSGFQALVGTGLLLTAAAVLAVERWFAALCAAVGAGWLVLAVDVASNGFEHPALTSVAALGLIAWVVGLTVVAATARGGRRPASGDTAR